MRTQSESPGKRRLTRAFIIALCVCLLAPAGAATFAGTHAPDPIYVGLQVALDAPEPLNSYAFELIPSADNPAGDPVEETLSILSRSDGRIPVLDNLPYAVPGTYRYALQQKSLPLPGIVFDSGVFELEVTVTAAGGALEARLAAKDGGGSPIDASAVRFVNTYDPGAASVILSGEQLRDRGDERSYPYELRALTADAPSPASETASVSPFGTFRFGTVVFTEPGEYSYRISPSDPGPLSLDPGDYAVDVSVVPDSQGVLVASASIRDARGDAVPAIVFDSRADAPKPELLLSQALGDGEFTTEAVRAQSGDSVRFRLRVSNPSDAKARDLAVTFPAPEGLQIDAANLPEGASCQDGTIAWLVGDLEAGGSRELLTSAVIPEMEEDAAWTCAAVLDYSGDGPSGAGRSSDAAEVVTSNALEMSAAGRKSLQGAPDGAVVSSLEGTPQLTILMEQCLNDGFYSSDLMHTAAGDIATYRITIMNSSPSPAQKVNVTDTIPSGLTLVTNSITDGGIETNNVVTWDLGTIEAGASRSVSFQVQFPAASQFTTWTNTAMFNYQGHGYESSNSVSADQTPGVVPTNTPAPTVTPTPSPDPFATPIPTATPIPDPVWVADQSTPSPGPAPHTNDPSALPAWIALAIGAGAVAYLSARRLRKVRGN